MSLLARAAVVAAEAVVVLLSYGMLRGTVWRPTRKRERSIWMLAVSLSLPCMNCASSARISFPVRLLRTIRNLRLSTAYRYFQLQSGSELDPLVVSCFWSVPLASMVQICVDPDRFD